MRRSASCRTSLTLSGGWSTGGVRAWDKSAREIPIDMETTGHLDTLEYIFEQSIIFEEILEGLQGPHIVQTHHPPCAGTSAPACT